MIRLFIALAIPDEITIQINQLRKKICGENDKLKWEDNSKIHLTLKFIGEVSESLLQPISQELSFLEQFNKINCTTSKFGFFFKQNNDPKILWLGLDLDDSVAVIVDELNQRLAKLSIPIEKRKFNSHLTLLRIKNHLTDEFVNRFLNTNVPRFSFNANKILLMQSELLPHGSTYKEIKKYYLK